ncbi:hypothetical protein EX30DRAFT_363154 [Ascodesmis nigricans]|uniref:Uncharacterized protein n=1 Tax=Ascodesmis nigricans TaxID=341454 RepID=A0A4S2MZL9_9PEZI|nr:hypothetical protein EX30DRAFT_363154 [Ascodesmis nigricans]
MATSGLQRFDSTSSSCPPPPRSGAFTPNSSSTAGYDNSDSEAVEIDEVVDTPRIRRYHHRRHQREERHRAPSHQTRQQTDFRKLEDLVTKLLDERFRTLDSRIDAFIQRQTSEGDRRSRRTPTPPPMSNINSNKLPRPSSSPSPFMADTRKAAIERRLQQLFSTKSQIDETYTRWLSNYTHELNLLHNSTWAPSSASTPPCPCECRSITTLLGPSLPRLDTGDSGNIETAVLQWCTRIDDRVAVWGEEIVCPLLCVPLQEERRLWKWYSSLGEKERRRITEGQGCWERFREEIVRGAGNIERWGVGRAVEKHIMAMMTVAFALFLWALWCVWEEWPDDVPGAPIRDEREWPWPRV